MQNLFLECGSFSLSGSKESDQADNHAGKAGDELWWETSQRAWWLEKHCEDSCKDVAGWLWTAGEWENACWTAYDSILLGPLRGSPCSTNASIQKLTVQRICLRVCSGIPAKRLFNGHLYQSVCNAESESTLPKPLCWNKDERGSSLLFETCVTALWVVVVF